MSKLLKRVDPSASSKKIQEFIKKIKIEHIAPIESVALSNNSPSEYSGTLKELETASVPRAVRRLAAYTLENVPKKVSENSKFFVKVFAPGTDGNEPPSQTLAFGRFVFTVGTPSEKDPIWEEREPDGPIEDNVEDIIASISKSTIKSKDFGARENYTFSVDSGGFDMSTSMLGNENEGIHLPIGFAQTMNVAFDSNKLTKLNTFRPGSRPVTISKNPVRRCVVIVDVTVPPDVFCAEAIKMANSGGKQMSSAIKEVVTTVMREFKGTMPSLLTQFSSFIGGGMAVGSSNEKGTKEVIKYDE